MTWIFVLLLTFFNVFYEEEKNMFLMFFYFQFNVFIIYAVNTCQLNSCLYCLL